MEVKVNLQTEEVRPETAAVTVVAKNRRRRRKVGNKMHFTQFVVPK